MTNLSTYTCLSGGSETQMDTSTTYNYKVVRQFAVVTVIWGIVGIDDGLLTIDPLILIIQSDVHDVISLLLPILMPRSS